MGTDDTNMGWNCTVTDNHVQSCMKPTATRLSPQGTKQHVSKFTLGTNSPSLPHPKRPHLCANGDGTQHGIQTNIILVI